MHTGTEVQKMSSQPFSNILIQENTLCTISILRGINKPLQRLPRYAELWEGQGVCRIFQRWGHFFLGP